MPARRRSETFGQLREDPALETRHLHLGDPEGVRDLLLRPFLDETHAQQLALPVVELGEGLGEPVPPVDLEEALVLPAERVAEPHTALTRAHGLIERERVPGAARVGDLRGAHSEASRDLVVAGLSPELLREFVRDHDRAPVQVLHSSRRTDRPAQIAEVPLELAGDRRHREGREACTALGSES